MFIGGFKQVEDIWALSIGSAAAAAFEIAADGAGDTVFIHLADVHEEVAVLSASVIPLLEELLQPRYMGAEASRPVETVESPDQIFGWQIRTKHVYLSTYLEGAVQSAVPGFEPTSFEFVDEFLLV